MITVELQEADDFCEWRDAARQMMDAGHRPDQLVWKGAGCATYDLFAAPSITAIGARGKGPHIRCSQQFLDLAQSVILHSDPARFDLLYRILWRLQQQPLLMNDAVDRDVRALQSMARQVRRDIHKMRAFLRFRCTARDNGQHHYVAWFEPDHRIERANAQFFIDRFANQPWSIFTPRLSLHWDGRSMAEGPAGSRDMLPDHDAAEELWLGYYKSVFNPSRLKIGAMLKEMPRRYWKNMPETRLVPQMIAGAQKRETQMVANGSDLFGEMRPGTLRDVGQGIASCQHCAIGCNSTRAVSGEGPANALLMIVGEQPGDQEEQQGRPFVGPAGQLLEQHLAAAGIDRRQSYITNAVKHFKFTRSGKRRLHQNPTAGEIDRCRWWLDAERALIQPRFILALGASAGRACLGRTPSINNERGRAMLLPDGSQLWLTVHPSYLLRLEGHARADATIRFQNDLDDLVKLMRPAT